jgi:hypothetical protein
MDRRHLLEIMATTTLGFALIGSGAVAQQKPIKDQLVGAWTLLLDDAINPDGTHIPTFGPNPARTLIFTPNGRYFASNNRDAGTAEENKAVSQGTISHFGTYTVDEGGKTLSFHVEGSSFPNRENTIQRTLVTAITDEVLTYTNPTSSTPGQGFTHTELAWKKLK